MRQNSMFGTLVFIVILGLGAAIAYAVNGIAGNFAGVAVAVVAFVVAGVASAAIRVADQWDRAVILRLGQFHALKGPGLFFLIPVVDTIPYWIDTRVITTGFKAEKTLTKDCTQADPRVPSAPLSNLEPVPHEIFARAADTELASDSPRLQLAQKLKNTVSPADFSRPRAQRSVCLPAIFHAQRNISKCI